MTSMADVHSQAPEIIKLRGQKAAEQIRIAFNKENYRGTTVGVSMQ
jgi:hypothetical protein